MLGESAIENGQRSSKARHSHSELWHATEVAPSVLAFAATVVSATQSPRILETHRFYLLRLTLFSRASPPSSNPPKEVTI